MCIGQYIWNFWKIKEKKKFTASIKDLWHFEMRIDNDTSIEFVESFHWNLRRASYCMLSAAE